jgi:cytoskeleton protein RodZ
MAAGAPPSTPAPAPAAGTPEIAAVPPAPPPLPGAAPPSAATGATYGDQSGAARVQVHAVADTWVQVRGPGGEALFTRTLKSGDVYNVPSRDDLVLVTGNAGGVELTVDGKSLGKLGQTGQVRRNVSLAAASLLAQPPR